MPNFLELDRPTLNYFTYHWFWGLYYSNAPQPINIGTAVDVLLHDEIKLTHLMESQQNLHQHHAVLRFFIGYSISITTRTMIICWFFIMPIKNTYLVPKRKHLSWVNLTPY